MGCQMSSSSGVSLADNGNGQGLCYAVILGRLSRKKILHTQHAAVGVVEGSLQKGG